VAKAVSNLVVTEGARIKFSILAFPAIVELIGWNALKGVVEKSALRPGSEVQKLGRYDRGVTLEDTQLDEITGQRAGLLSRPVDHA
jgi:hypothetical protein